MKRHRFALYFALLAGAPFAARAAPKVEYAESSYVTGRTRLWNEPNRFGEAIAILEPGLRVEVLTYTSAADWVEIRTPSGREGWVLLRFTALANRRNKDILVGSRDPSRPRDPAADGDVQALTTEAPPDESTEADAAGGGGSDLPNVANRKSKLTDSEGAETVDEPVDSDTRRSKYSPQSAQAPVESDRQLRKQQQMQERRRGRKGQPQDAAYAEGEELGRGNREYTRPEFNFGFGYHQQLTPEGMPGFAFTPRYFRPLSASLDWGGGLDWIFVTKGTTDLSPDVYASTRKTQNHFNLHGGLRYRKGAFRMFTSVGWDMQRTSRRTVDLDDNSVIVTNPAGEYVTGSGWSHGVRLRLAPAYMFMQDAQWAFGLEAFYSLRYEFGSDTGVFAGPASSRVAHSLGLGVSVSRIFE